VRVYASYPCIHCIVIGYVRLIAFCTHSLWLRTLCWISCVILARIGAWT